MAPAITNSKNTISNKNITIPPAPGEDKRETTSWNKDCGKRAIIPIRIMNEIPLPIPLSVILSPSHRINILPAAKMMVEVIIKNVQSNEALSDGPACIFKLIRYEGAWKIKIAIVNIRVY